MAFPPDKVRFATQVNLLQSLVPQLPKSVPTARHSDRINQVFGNIISSDDDDAWPVFNRRFDILFGEDQRNADGRLSHLRRGALGMDLVIAYLHSTLQTDILWAAAEPKLNRLVDEVTHLM